MAGLNGDALVVVRLVRDLESLIEPLSRGDPESALRWTCKSVRKLAQELGRVGHRVSHWVSQQITWVCT